MSGDKRLEALEHRIRMLETRCDDQLGTREVPAPTPLGEVSYPFRDKEVVQHSGLDLSSQRNNATAPLVGADPPWLDVAAAIIACAYEDEPGCREAMDLARRTLRAVIAFAARQPREITEARPPWRECAALLVGRLLDYFDSYNLATAAPLVEEIAQELTRAFDSGQREPRPITGDDRVLYSKFLDDVGFSDDPDASAWANANEAAFLDLIAAAREEGRRERREITRA